jgi:hypothetical protein
MVSTVGVIWCQVELLKNSSVADLSCMHTCFYNLIFTLWITWDFSCFCLKLSLLAAQPLPLPYAYSQAIPVDSLIFSPLDPGCIFIAFQMIFSFLLMPPFILWLRFVFSAMSSSGFTWENTTWKLWQYLFYISFLLTCKGKGQLFSE